MILLNAASKPHSCHHIIHLAANCLLRMLSHSMSHSIIGMLSTSFHVTFYNWSGGWWLVVRVEVMMVGPRSKMTQTVVIVAG